jgi:SAM-dependent methyltransferase
VPAINNSATAEMPFKPATEAPEGSTFLLEENQPPDRRSAAYADLIRSGFRFAGVELGQSLWTRSEAIANSGGVAPVVLPTIPVDGPTKAFFDGVSSPLYISGSLNVVLSGWAFVEQRTAPTPDVFIEVRDVRTGKTEYYPAHRHARPDVARHFNNKSLEMSGFRATIPMRKRFFPNGLRLRVVQAVGKQLYTSATELVVERGMQDFAKGVREELARTFLRGSGIEIGALQRKLIVPSGCEVRYVDRMSISDLLRHYPELAGMPLQAPDLIDDGEQLNTIAGRSLDFVIANHFFEHSENPIQTLSNLLRVLKATGVLFMAVPDKRYTFDSQRPSTSFSTVKETYENGRRADRNQLYEQWARFVEMAHEDSVPVRSQQLMDEKYSIHFNVWDLDELLSFLLSSRAAFRLPLEILAAVTSDNENIVLLERTA